MRRLGCSAVESMHHIFVDCIHFAVWRSDAASELLAHTALKLSEAEISVDDQQGILRAAKFLFIDDAVTWPLKISQYYVGQIPSIRDLFTATMIPGVVKRRKLTSHISADWHTSSIRLAGRIFGSIQRTMAARVAGAV
ncbi:hypothetical protein B0H16DRAFT_1541173 [Mycena metata]|uniref:Uncharacterized protein n=1 Tax=Mycena metata TaxID=1033252 RepID=A0AAD7J3L9_9AGAR|nr:hypothetical protein B0H16DRAFT_1541173 [Mycena metata]